MQEHPTRADCVRPSRLPTRTAFWSHYLVHCWNSPSFSIVFGYFSKLKCRAFCSHLKPAPAFLRQQPRSFPLFFTNKQTVVLRVELSWSHQEDCLLGVLRTYQLQSSQVQSLENAPTREREREPERMHRRHIIIVARQYARQLKPASAQTLSQDIEKI
jgi:hypothetical protein